jgi:uncharacterized membrane protein YccC
MAKLPELRMGLRVTVAAVASYALANFLRLPMALWAVLTALLVTQLSAGHTMRAAVNYFVGTLIGVAYTILVVTLIPHASGAELLMVLAIAVAPLALLAAYRPGFLAAPFSAVIVVLVPALVHASALDSAYYRVIEVALGGLVAVVVSLFVFPDRATS